MAKRFVRISLGTKFRLLLGAAVIGIITAALVVPWYFMELQAEQGLQHLGRSLTRLRLNEWVQYHPKRDPRARDSHSQVVGLYTNDGKATDLDGPSFIRMSARPDASGEDLPPVHEKALAVFGNRPDQDVFMLKAKGKGTTRVYRFIRAVRVDGRCVRCHDQTRPAQLQYRPDQLVGLVDVSLGSRPPGGASLFWTRVAFLAGGGLAATLALLLLPLITGQLVLKPVRVLTDLADKVTEGDVSVRSSINSAFA